MKSAKRRKEEALIEAAASGDLESLKKSLEDGVSANVKFRDGYTALMAAAQAGQIEAVKILLSHGADVESFDKYGKTALIAAAGTKRIEVVKALLNTGADVNAQHFHAELGSPGKTALMVATKEVIDVLIAKSANVNAQDKGGETALMMAAFFGRINSVRKLIAAGADVNLKTVNGETALTLADSIGQIAIVELLKQAGAKQEE